MLDHLAQPILCPSAFQWHARKQPTREGHDCEAVYNERRGQNRGLGWESSGILQCRRIRAQTYWTTPASPNPLSLRITKACEEDSQPTRERHE
uniref:Uncharacterized protein n=1 Tax=Mesocestoides corti TaxID=53468 RepID=A0A5K3F9C7_MESCO